MSKKRGFLGRVKVAARYAFGYDAAKNTVSLIRKWWAEV